MTNILFAKQTEMNSSRFIPHSSHKYAAFTLAEVLITLGIIGIVAALTIPTLINNAQDRQFKVLFKKTYADISNAYSVANQVEPFIVNGRWEQSLQKIYYEIFSRLKTTSFCIRDYSTHSCDGDGNYSTNVDCTSLNGDSSICFYDGSGGYAQLTNGARINIQGTFAERPLFVIDVNGNRKPNTVGRDIFIIYIRDKVIPAGAPGYNPNGMGCDKNIKSTNGATSAQGKSGAGCAYKYLYE